MFLYQSKTCEWCYDWFAEDWHSSIIDSEEERRMQVFSIFTPQLFPENLQCDFEDNSAFESVIVRRAESVLHRLFTYDIFRLLFENLYAIHCLKIPPWGILSTWHVHWTVFCVLDIWKSIWFINMQLVLSIYLYYYYGENQISRACISFEDFRV